MIKIIKNKKAFSLTEIAFFIAIIGFLVLGIFTGQSLIDYARLSKAKTFTESFLRENIESGIVLWLETTSKESFREGEGEVDSTSISQWSDLSPQSMMKKHATQTTNARQPNYVKKAINKLPAISFDGSTTAGQQDFLNAPFALNPSATDITIFVVANFDNTSLTRYILKQDGADEGDILYEDSGTIRSAVAHATASVGSSITSEESVIYTVKLDSSDTRYIYTNGSLDDSDILASRASLTSDLIIGASSSAGLNPFDGYIGEIIMYDRALTDSQQDEVEEYLSQKWDIELN